MYRGIFTNRWILFKFTCRKKKNYIYILYGSISCIMYLMYSSHFFPSISLELFPSPFKARKRQTFDGIEGEKRSSDSSKWCIRVTCAKVPTDHRRLTPKEQPWNLASKRENKDRLRVNLLLSLTSPPRPSNPQFACSKQRKRRRRTERERGASWTYRIFNILPTVGNLFKIHRVHQRKCERKSREFYFFFFLFFLQKLKFYVWVNDIAIRSLTSGFFCKYILFRKCVVKIAVIYFFQLNILIIGRRKQKVSSLEYSFLMLKRENIEMSR